MLEFFILLAPLGKKIIAFMSEDFKYTAVLSLAIDRFVWWQWELSVLKMELAIDNE